MRIKLVENHKTLHKTYTVIFSILLIMLSILEIVQPYLEVLAPIFAPGMFPIVSAGIGIAIAIGRYIKQDLADGKLDGRVGDADKD